MMSDRIRRVIVESGDHSTLPVAGSDAAFHFNNAIEEMENEHRHPFVVSFESSYYEQPPLDGEERYFFFVITALVEYDDD